MLEQLVIADLRACIQLVALVQAQRVEQRRVIDLVAARLRAVVHGAQRGHQRRGVGVGGRRQRVHRLLQIGHARRHFLRVDLVVAVDQRENRSVGTGRERGGPGDGVRMALLRQVALYFPLRLADFFDLLRLLPAPAGIRFSWQQLPRVL